MAMLSGPVLVQPLLYTAIASDLNIAAEHVAALMPSSYAVGSLLLMMPGSWFMERHGVHRSFIIGALCQCMAAVAQAFSAHLWQLVALQVLLGCCHCFAGTVGFIAFCNTWFGNDSPSTAISFNFAAFGLASPTVVSPLGAVCVIANSIISAIVLKEQFTVRNSVGLLLTVCGAFVVVVNAPPTIEHLTIERFLGLLMARCAAAAAAAQFGAIR